MADAITNAGITARTNSSHRSAVERRDAAVAAAVAAERARLAKQVDALFGTFHPMAAVESEPTNHDVVSRKAVLDLLR